jgi:hypothetical protein
MEPVIEQSQPGLHAGWRGRTKTCCGCMRAAECAHRGAAHEGLDTERDLPFQLRREAVAQVHVVAVPGSQIRRSRSLWR